MTYHGTSVLFTSHPQDGLAVNFYILHNRRTPLQAEEALSPISIPQGSSEKNSYLYFQVIFGVNINCICPSPISDWSHRIIYKFICIHIIIKVEKKTLIEGVPGVE
jgi:hypothetical protein